MREIQYNFHLGWFVPSIESIMIKESSWPKEELYFLHPLRTKLHHLAFGKPDIDLHNAYF